MNEPDASRDERVEGGDPNLPGKVKARVESIGEALKEGLSGEGHAGNPIPQEIDPEELKKYPDFYRIRQLMRDRGFIGTRWIRHRDDERYDNVTIEIVERYKTSGLSGDEWRFSVVAKIWWKGQVIGSRGCGTMEYALRIIDHWVNCLQEYIEWEFKNHSDEPGGHPWKIVWPADKLRAAYCFQPGCAEKAISTYRAMKLYRRDGTEKEQHGNAQAIRFCAKHSHRGDCGLQDADLNYELIEGPGLGGEDAEHRAAKSQESAFGGVIDATGE